MFSTSEGSHDACGGVSRAHWGDIQYIGGTIMHLEGVMNHVGLYHEYIRGCSVHRGFQYKSKAFTILLSHMNHNIPSDVLMVFLRCTEYLPIYS